MVYSDHKNLSYFTITKKLNRQQIGWVELLASYDFQIHYWKESENGRADALSQRSDLTTEETQERSLFTEKGKTLVHDKPEVATLHQDNTPKQRHVPEKDQRKVISNHHDGPLLGNPRRDKTIELIQWRYQFLNMRKAVEDYIWQCTTCAQNKLTRHKPYGEQQQIEAPQQAWQEITMDFIAKLPLSKDTITNIKYNSILVVVDRLMKYAHFLPWKEKGNAKDLAKVMLKKIIANHGIPQSIISDKDKLFTSKFWNTWTQQLGTKVKLLTAYHPQTDRQTEQTNQTLEQYLRHYINFKQNNWINLLPLAQYAYNNHQHRISPFYANYGKHPNWDPNNNITTLTSEAATTKINKIVKFHGKLSWKVNQGEKDTAKQVNKKRLKGPTFERGDKVYLFTKNLKFKRPSSKLDHVRIGLFEVEKQTSKVNYWLKLPAKAQIHPNFPISLLEPAPKNAPIQTKWNIEEEEEYDVKKILDSRKINERNHYHVKWLRYGNKENLWEPTENFSPKAFQKIEEYWQKLPKPKAKANQTSRWMN